MHVHPLALGTTINHDAGPLIRTTARPWDIRRGKEAEWKQRQPWRGLPASWCGEAKATMLISPEP